MTESANRQITRSPDRQMGPSSPLAKTFGEIYRSGLWTVGPAKSGCGSTLAAAAAIAGALPGLIRRLGVKSVLDIPCGDFHWMAAVEWPEGVRYVGADVVPELIECNRRVYRDWPPGGPRGPVGAEFQVLDLTTDPLPAVDLVWCRDCLVHLSYAHITAALWNVGQSGAKWFACTSFRYSGRVNADIASGGWRPLSLTAAPFNLPEPEEWLPETPPPQGGEFADKAVGVWRIPWGRGGVCGDFVI